MKKYIVFAFLVFIGGCASLQTTGVKSDYAYAVAAVDAVVVSADGELKSGKISKVQAQGISERTKEARILLDEAYSLRGIDKLQAQDLITKAVQIISKIKSEL